MGASQAKSKDLKLTGGSSKRSKSEERKGAGAIDPAASTDHKRQRS